MEYSENFDLRSVASDQGPWVTLVFWVFFLILASFGLHLASILVDSSPWRP